MRLSASLNGMRGTSCFLSGGFAMRRMISTSACDEKLLAAIGSIAAESAYLERDIETMLYKLTKLPREIGQSIIEKPMMDAKTDLLRAVATAKLKRRPKKVQRLEELVSKIKHCNTDRVTAIHGIWTRQITRSPSGGRQFGPASATKRTKGGSERNLPASRAQKVALDISEAHWDLYDFAEETWPRLFPRLTLPPPPPPPDHHNRDTKANAT